MLASRFLLAGLVAVMCGAPLDAAADQTKDQVRLRKLASRYAACVVRKHHAKASEAILTTVSAGTIMRNFAQLADSDCLGAVAGRGVDMRFPNDTLEYALADALVNVDFGVKEITSFADRLPLAQPPMMTSEQQAKYLAKIKSSRERKEAEGNIERQRTLSLMLRYGECVVRDNPVEARFWLLTPSDTPEESSRIRAMQSTLAACLSEGTMRINRIALRGVVAVNYYRLAMATVVPAAGSVS